MTGNGWLPAALWTVGVPAVLVTIVLSSAVLTRRYARLVECVPETDRFLPKTWIAQHRQLCLRTLFAVYFLMTVFRGRLGGIADKIFAALILCYALSMSGWAMWRLGSGRASGAPSRAYCLGLLVGALFLLLFAGFFYELSAL